MSEGNANPEHSEKLHEPVSHAFAEASAEAMLEEVKTWASQLADYGWPHFGEFAQRCQCLRPVLLRSMQAASAASSTSNQHSQQIDALIGRLDGFTAQLSGTETCFTSWQAACREFEQILNAYTEFIRETSG